VCYPFDQLKDWLIKIFEEIKIRCAIYGIKNKLNKTKVMVIRF